MPFKSAILIRLILLQEGGFNSCHRTAWASAAASASRALINREGIPQNPNDLERTCRGGRLEALVRRLPFDGIIDGYSIASAGTNVSIIASAASILWLACFCGACSVRT